VSEAAQRRLVVVTGAGSGLGLATAVRLARANYRVAGAVLTGEEAESLTSAASSAGVEIPHFFMDVTRQDSVAEGVEGVISRLGTPWGLVQFAGLGLRGFFEDLQLSEIRRVFDVNVFGMMAVTQAMMPHMRTARTGRIVLVSSIAGRMASMSIGGYASSKFAVEGFGESLRQELYPFGIYVSLLEPGLVSTPHFTRNRNRARKAVSADSPYYQWFCQHEKMVDDLLARNSITPDDVAAQVERILRSGRPAMRYIVGWKAKLVINLCRYAPGEWAQEAYWGMVRRMVTRPRRQAESLAGLDEREFSR